MPGFSDRQEIVIRGALEIESGSSDNPATVVRNALLDILGENWSIIMYDTWCGEENAICSPYLRYQNKYVHGVRTTTASSEEAEEIWRFLDTEFAWATISDFREVQSTAEQKINNTFVGWWKVNAIKFRNDSWWNADCWGLVWEHGNYTFFVLRTS
jgi:hypothetical protein